VPGEVEFATKTGHSCADRCRWRAEVQEQHPDVGSRVAGGQWAAKQRVVQADQSQGWDGQHVHSCRRRRKLPQFTIGLGLNGEHPGDFRVTGKRGGVDGREPEQHARIVGHAETVGEPFEDVETCDLSSAVDDLVQPSLAEPGGCGQPGLADASVLLDEAQQRGGVALPKYLPELGPSPGSGRNLYGTVSPRSVRHLTARPLSR
jgi:hypothetical protein